MAHALSLFTGRWLRGALMFVSASGKPGVDMNGVKSVVRNGAVTSAASIAETGGRLLRAPANRGSGIEPEEAGAFSSRNFVLKLETRNYLHHFRSPQIVQVNDAFQFPILIDDNK
jgi:hypothetical protein